MQDDFISLNVTVQRALLASKLAVFYNTCSAMATAKQGACHFTQFTLGSRKAAEESRVTQQL